MASDRLRRERLSLTWDEIVAGRAAPTNDGLEAESIAALAWFQSLTGTPIPEAARERSRRVMQTEIARAIARGEEQALMETVATWQRMPLSIGQNGRYAPPHTVPRRRTREKVRWAWVQVATALLLVLTFVFGYLAFHDEQPAIIPAADATPPPATPTADWPIYRADPARTGAVELPGPAANPAVLWTFQAGGRINDAPVVVGNVIYFDSADGNLYALDTASGKQLWATPLGVGSGASLAVQDGVIITADDNLVLRAYDAATGAERWHADGLGGNDPGPIVDGVVFTGGSDGKVHALQASSGEELWSTAVDGGPSRSISYDDGVIYEGTGNGHIVALNATNGALLWSVDLGGGTVGTAAVARGIVYGSSFSGPDNKLVALDAASGTRLWSFQTPAKADLRSPAIGANTIYTVSGDGNVYALDAKTGQQSFSFSIGGPITAAPALAGDAVYAASKDGNIYAIDAATGAERWRLAYGSTTDYGPVVAGGKVFVTTDAGTVVAIGVGSATSTSGSPAATQVAAPGTPAANGSTEGGQPLAFVWATSGEGQNTLVNPGALTVDPTGRIWVSSMPGSFLIFDLDGNYLETWGTSGAGEGEFSFDAGFANVGQVTFAPDGGFYVADFANARIEQFDAQRHFVRQWGTPGDGDGQFHAPTCVAFDGNGNLLVSDFNRHDVQRFTPDGVFIDKFGSHGSGDGQFENPGCLAVAPDGTIWVADVSNNRIEVFQPDGTFAFSFGGPGGNGNGHLNAPVQVAFDDAGNAYVADQNNNVIQVFDHQGQFLFQFGGFGAGDGQMNTPAGIAIYHGKTIFVLDWKNARIEKFKITGPLPGPAATPAS